MKSFSQQILQKKATIPVQWWRKLLKPLITKHPALKNNLFRLLCSSETNKTHPICNCLSKIVDVSFLDATTFKVYNFARSCCLGLLKMLLKPSDPWIRHEWDELRQMFPRHHHSLLRTGQLPQTHPFCEFMLLALYYQLWNSTYFSIFVHYHCWNLPQNAEINFEALHLAICCHDILNWFTNEKTIFLV